MTTLNVASARALVVSVALILTAGCAGRAANDDARSAPAVRLVAVESSAGAGATVYSAVIAPNAQVDLAFRVSGYVVDIHRTRGSDGRTRALEPGATIARGVTLGRVRSIDYQAVADKARGARDESSAGVTVAEAGLAEAQAGLTQAEADFGRISVLWQQESVTKPAYDGTKARLDAARAKVDAATAAVTAAKQRAAAAAAQLQEAEIALGDTELRAPFDAVLLARHVEVRALVAPGAPAFSVADLRLGDARFKGPDAALRLFRAGQLVALTVDASPNERFEGHVLSVAPAADPNARSFEIVVAIDNPGLTLRSGMISSIRVTNEAAEHPQLRIPIDALVHDPARDQYLVYTLEEKNGRTVAKALDVRPGPLVGNQVSILEGLSPGQRIVASGANLLRPGDAGNDIHEPTGQA